MTKKLFFFDIDGTLLDSEKKLPESTIKAVKSLKNDGHHVAIATGRAPYMFDDILAELDIHTYVSMNGQFTVVNDEVIDRDPIDRDDASIDYRIC